MSENKKHLEVRIEKIERSLQDLQSLLSATQHQLSASLDRLKKIEAGPGPNQDKYKATCPACRTPYDMLAHHYSIGLFDNLVYIKCPKCHKALPIQGDGQGGVQAVTD